MTQQHWTALTQAAPKLRAEYGASAPNYRKLLILCCDGAIPAEKRNAQWFVPPVPAIAAALGLTTPTERVAA